MLLSLHEVSHIPSISLLITQNVSLIPRSCYSLIGREYEVPPFIIKDPESNINVLFDMVDYLPPCNATLKCSKDDHITQRPVTGIPKRRAYFERLGESESAPHHTG